MEPLIMIPIIASFLLVLFSMNFWIRKEHQIGLVGEDLHKKDNRKVASSGGIIIVLGFLFGVLIYIAIETFYFNSSENLISILAMLVSILIISITGLIDDLFSWKKRIANEIKDGGGLSARLRVLLVLLAAVPLMVINAGTSTIMGLSLGLLYPLILVPIGIIGASTAFNILAGYNGLESSQGIIILSALSIVTFFTGARWLSLISLIMIGCLLAFYFFNKTPAKIFPGDVMTYSVGALIAIIAILGNIEKIAVFFFIPYIIEAILKIRGGLKKQSFAKLNDEGGLEVPYEKFYGLEHVAIYIASKIRGNKKVREIDVVLLINEFQILIILIGFFIFREGIF